MDNMYYDERDIRKSVKRVSIVAVFAFLLASVAFIQGSFTNAKKVEYGEVKIAFTPYSITYMLGGLDSLAKHDVNDDLALLLMREIDMQHPHIVLAQMKLESGNYQSKLAKENNNYFGMRHPAQRLTVSVKSKNGYAHYRNWCYSVLDYALWQRRYAYNLSEDDYLTKLSNVYAEDEKYIDKVSKIAKNIWKN